MRQAGRARRTRGRVVVAMMAAGLLCLPAAAQVTTQAPLGPVGVNTSPAAQRATGVAVELHGDEPLAQYLILRFMEGHPDLAWRIRGREAYARGDYERARECFERAARFADKPSQAMLGEMHWEGLGGQRDRALGYAWMDLAAERYYEDFYLLRERYWSQLGAQEREQALRRGQPLLRKYGDDKAKRRLARILVRERPDQLAIGGFFGNLPIIPPSGAGRDSITLRGSEYFDDTFWEPDAYFAWQDTIWKTLLTTGRVEVGDPARAGPAAAD